MRPETDVEALCRLAALLRVDLADVDEVVVEVTQAAEVLERPAPSTLEIYGAGKLLHDFYCGVERSFCRVAARFGGLPDGSTWQRTLLEGMAVELAALRPRVISRRTRDELDEVLRAPGGAPRVTRTRPGERR